MRRLGRLIWTLMVTGFAVYVLFFVQLGERTPFQHLVRIMNTDEARELGHEMGAATARVRDEIGEQFRTATEPGENAPAQGEKSPAAKTDDEAIADPIADRVKGVIDQVDRHVVRVQDAQDSAGE